MRRGEYTPEQYARIRRMAREASDRRAEEWARRFPVAPLSGMVRVVLLGCVAEKGPRQAPARDLYVSQLWRARRAYAEAVAPDRWCILSAAWGLLHPTEEITPYDRTLSDMRKDDREAWARHAASRLRGFGYAPPERLTVEVHAGKAYRVDLVPLLRRSGIEVLEPLAELGIGEQLRWYRDQRAHQLTLAEVMS
jgi:hypothetical protein